MDTRSFFFLFFLTFFFPKQVPAQELYNAQTEAFSPFSAALQTLQIQIGYNFTRLNLLRRAMTHPSYSGDNNKALSVAGFYFIETAISLHYLEQNSEITAKDLSLKISELSREVACSKEGSRLALQTVVRVSRKTDRSPAVVCGAYRALFAAIAVDSGKGDVASSVYWDSQKGWGLGSL